MLTPVAASFLRPPSRARKSHRGLRRPGRRQDDAGACAVRRDRPAGGDRHLRDRVRAAPARAATGTRSSTPGRPGPAPVSAALDGRQAGEFTLDEALVDSFRFNLSRQIVGEVRGPEIWAMIKAMESGTGSISTTHASDAVAAIRKLVTCAMEAGPHVTQSARDQQARRDHRPDRPPRPAHHDRPDGGSQRRRRVAEIIAVDPGRAGDGLRDHARLRARRRTASPCPACCPTPTGRWPAHGFDLAATSPQQDGAAMIALVPALAGALIVARPDRHWSSGCGRAVREPRQRRHREPPAAGRDLAAHPAPARRWLGGGRGRVAGHRAGCSRWSLVPGRGRRPARCCSRPRSAADPDRAARGDGGMDPLPGRRADRRGRPGAGARRHPALDPRTDRARGHPAGGAAARPVGHRGRAARVRRRARRLHRRPRRSEPDPRRPTPRRRAWPASSRAWPSRWPPTCAPVGRSRPTGPSRAPPPAGSR